jgi:hypothetical protein
MDLLHPIPNVRRAPQQHFVVSGHFQRSRAQEPNGNWTPKPNNDTT